MSNSPHNSTASVPTAPAPVMSTGEPRRSVLELVFAWSGAAFAVAYSTGWVLLARMVPPPDPDWSAGQLADFVDEHRFGIRLGMVVGMFACGLLVPFFTYISAHIARVEPGWPLLAVCQGLAAGVLTVFFLVPTMLWLTMSFRTDLAAESVRMLNDLAWLMFVMVTSTFIVQCVAFAAAGLRYAAADDPVFPRWFCYFTLWMAMAACGGSLAVFFKDGPFAWNGAIAFYTPVPIFGVWMGLLTLVLHRGTRLGLTRRSMPYVR
jgi:hypothetical protein